MKDVSYAFFPIVAEGQYYVIVFNLLKADAEILDNEKDCDYNKYKEVFDSVKALFLKYLKKHQHPCVEKLTKEKPAKVLKFKWRTEKNKIDSGLYIMMHMELYQGESATKWKTDIVEENNKDCLKQMTNRRMRYITKIMMHEMNTKRGLMPEYANKFGEDNKEEEKVKNMVEDAIKKRIEEGGTVLLTPLPPGKSNNAYKSSQGHLSSRHGLTLKKFKKDAPCQAFKNQERHRLKGESSPSQRLKGESSPSPLLVSTRRNQQHLGRAFT
ncbi:ulp1 protease family, C-terminal catalytic domain-containing protein [Tanacetum coccineum]